MVWDEDVTSQYQLAPQCKGCRVNPHESSVPSENLTLYSILYEIEVGLREFIIEVLETKFGMRWWKERLPGDVLCNFRKAHQVEKKAKWSQLVPHHPLYYIDFPDLTKVITRKDNWALAFQGVFKSKEVLIGTLRELEPIRNKIAHNRKATETDLRIAKAAHGKVAAAIGVNNFRSYVARCTSAESLDQTFKHLRDEAATALNECLNYKPLGALARWRTTAESWWFDAQYLGNEVSAVYEYFDNLMEYEKLPREQGLGHIIEAWVKSQNLQEQCDKAMQELSDLISIAEAE